MINIRSAKKAISKQTALVAHATWGAGVAACQKISSGATGLSSHERPAWSFQEFQTALIASGGLKLSLTTGSLDPNPAFDANHPGMNLRDEPESKPSSHVVTQDLFVELDNETVS